jgi:ATP-dependent DNA helicase RecQ
VLKGDLPVQLRESTSQRSEKKSRSRSAPSPAAANLGQDAMVRYINLKAWRAEVAKEHNLLVYVIFHDATLAEIAESAPQSLGDLQGNSGLGVKKLEAYVAQVLRVCNGAS